MALQILRVDRRMAKQVLQVFKQIGKRVLQVKGRLLGLDKRVLRVDK